jgi:aspartyl-tRNA(Asn)/glutamyl-tRNA(Gln) amidotransferase subunit B
MYPRRSFKTYGIRITHELLGQLARRDIPFNTNPIAIEQMGDLIDLIQSKTITGTS